MGDYHLIVRDYSIDKFFQWLVFYKQCQSLYKYVYSIYEKASQFTPQ